MNDNIKRVNAPNGSGKRHNPAMSLQRDPAVQMKKVLMPGKAAPRSIKDELARLRSAVAAVQQIRLSAQHELEMAKKARAEAQRYQQETEAKARSEAQQLILKARLATRREIEELIRNAAAEIQKVLADIRVIRITAQEELATQRKFTDAARIGTISHESSKVAQEPDEKRQKQLVNSN